MSETHPSAVAIGRLATELQDADGAEQTVEAVVRSAVRIVGCTYASIVLTDGRQSLDLTALSDPKLAALHQDQVDLGEGPLITAAREGEELVVPDVLIETRWSHDWTNKALSAGIRSVVHVPLMAGNSPSAVLSLFSDKPNGFDVDDVAIAHVLASHAAAAIAAAWDESDSVMAVDARELIGQAIGILMERYHLDDGRAFEVLRRYSQDSDRTLRDVAHELTDSHNSPGDDTGSNPDGASPDS
ncbi:GAF and ANTAR domain-containing protein [Kribbella sp. NPDC054772]